MIYIPGSVQFLFTLVSKANVKITTVINAVNKLDAFGQIKEEYPEYKIISYEILS